VHISTLEYVLICTLKVLLVTFKRFEKKQTKKKQKKQVQLVESWQICPLINPPDVPVIRIIPCSLQITSPHLLIWFHYLYTCFSWSFTLCHPVSGFSSGFPFIWIWDLTGLCHGGLTLVVLYVCVVAKQSESDSFPGKLL